METLAEHRRSFIAVVDDMGMMMLSVVSGVLLVAEFVWSFSPKQLLAIEHADLIIALIFLMEFTVRLRVSSNKFVFIKKFGWELFAAIPVSSQWTQALRLLRLVRLSRLALHVKLLTKNGEAVSEYRIT